MYLVLLTTMLLLMIGEGALVNISGSLEIRDSTHICVKLQTNVYIHLNTLNTKRTLEAVKPFLFLFTNYDYGADY